MFYTVENMYLLFVLQEWTAKAEFTHHAHTASISAAATSERFVVTGSKDETIQLYDMKKKIEHGALLHHDGETSSGYHLFNVKS